MFVTAIFFFLIGTTSIKFFSAIKPEIYFKPNFNVSLFTGIWYQQAKFGPKLFGGLDQCGVLHFAYNPQANKIEVNYTSTSLLDHTKINYSGRAKYYNTNKKSGILEICWKYDPEYKQEAVTRLYIVDTNYNDFAVVASRKKNKSVSGWVISRERNLASAKNFTLILQQIINTMDKIEENIYEDVHLDSQTNCDAPKFRNPIDMSFLFENNTFNMPNNIPVS